jgi:hypothetical protein
MGYYLGTGFAGGPMAEGEASSFEVGGEVDDESGQTNLFSGVEMGSGDPPIDGLPDAAYHHDIWALTATERVTTLGGWYENEPHYYGLEYPPTAPAGGSGWSNYFFYGGPGWSYCGEFPTSPLCRVRR